MAQYGEGSCAVRFEEGPNDDCRYAVDCGAILYESSAYHFVTSADRTGHPGRRTGHNRRLFCIGHRGNDHDDRPISFGCHYGSGRRRGADDPVIVVARYPNFGRIDARPVVSMYFEARSGEPERSLCG